MGKSFLQCISGEHSPGECLIAVLAALIASPATAIFFTVLFGATALSGRFNVMAARCYLGAAFLVALPGLASLPAGEAVFWGLMLFAILVSLAWVLRPSLVPQFAGVIVPSRTFLFQRGRPKSRVEIGKSGSVLQWTGAEGQPMFEFTQNARLTIENIRGRLYVTTLVTDDNGKVIAEISRNHWRVAPPPGTWDLNYNRNTLEVRGVHGRIVLQVEMMADRIRLQGEWWSAPGVGVRLVGIAEGGLIGLFGPNYTVRQCPEIVPFFRYPSASNFGVLA